MKQGSTGLIKDTLTTWQPRYAESLTEEDARTIAANMTAFSQLLGQWARKEKIRESAFLVARIEE